MEEIEVVLEQIHITTCGRIFNKDTGAELHGAIDKDGYRIVTLRYKNKRKNYKWHRLVLYYFHKTEDYKKLQVNHKDGNKLNNCVLNLEWCNAKENIHHAWQNGIAFTTKDRVERGRQTRISQLDLSHVMGPEFKGQKPNIKLFLKARGYNWDDFEYIITDRTKTHHALGYLKFKENK